MKFSFEEKQLLKPFYTTNELGRYFGQRKNKFWIIYTTSKYKDADLIKPYPNIKNHLDKFKTIMTSTNKPYGLHRSRQEIIFKDEKILSLRKCSEKPTFTYTNFDTYVNRTFLIIKTQRINNKFLTAILNSKVIAFWLKHKGKMQGTNYQVDKNPLLGLPLNKPNKSISGKLISLSSKIINSKEIIADYTVLLEKAKSENNIKKEIKLSKILEKLNNDINSFEEIIDHMIYQSYGLSPMDVHLIEND